MDRIISLRGPVYRVNSQNIWGKAVTIEESEKDTKVCIASAPHPTVLPRGVAVYLEDAVPVDCNPCL